MDPPLYSGVKSAVDNSRWQLTKRPKTQTSPGKVLPSVFWDPLGILFIDYLEKGKTINSKFYIALLVCLKEEIAKKRPQMVKKKVPFHQDNAPYHKSIATITKLIESHFELLPHPPYSSDMAPVTTGCLQISKEGSRERDLAPVKKWYRKQRRILRPKTNRSTKKTSSVWEVLESIYPPRRGLCWIRLSS